MTSADFHACAKQFDANEELMRLVMAGKVAGKLSLSTLARIPLFSTPLRTFPLTHKSLLATLPYWTTLYHIQGFFCPPALQRGQLK